MYFYVVDVPDNEVKNKLAMHVTFFLEMVQDELKCVWTALGSLLSTETRDISQMYEAKDFEIESIGLITFCLRDLHQSYGAEGNSNDPTERSVTKEDNTQNMFVEQFSAFLIPIVSGLLSSVEKLSNSMQNLEYALPALELI